MGEDRMELVVPCGILSVLLNGNRIPFRVFGRKYDAEGVSVPVDFLEVDLSECSIGDELTVDIEGCQLEYDDSDERSVLLVADDGDYVLGVCGYEPQYHGDFEALRHCYELIGNDGGCFRYAVLRDPASYDGESRWSKRIPLAVCSVEKRLYAERLVDAFESIETVVFFALTAFVG